MPVDIDEVTPSDAEEALGCVRGSPERPSGLTSLPPAIWGFSVAQPTVSPGSICPLTRGGLSDAGASYSGGADPAAGNGGNVAFVRNAVWIASNHLVRRSSRSE